MFSTEETSAEREARVEREMGALITRHGVQHLADLRRGTPKRECETLAREAPNVYVRLMYADRHISAGKP